MIDYLVVGSGIAGMTFCHILQQHRKTFIVYDDGSQAASTVAGGLYNPVVLKRFTPVWKASEFMESANSFYEHWERCNHVNIHQKIPVYRRLASVQEQNTWFKAADNPSLQPYLSATLLKNTNPSLNAPFSLGEVLQTGKIDISRWQKTSKQQLRQANLLVEEQFDYNLLQPLQGEIRYKTIHAKNIVFCEGFGMHHNPFFRYLPLQGVKGELLTIQAPRLQLQQVIKSSIFIIPLGNNLYKVGATYDWNDKTQTPTPQARQHILTELKTLINCPFKITCQEAGIRPTVIDRRPLAGTHPIYKNLHILNGLGTRGVLIAPLVAHQLYNYIENRIPMPDEIDIRRFEKMNL
jgi:glycine oxidase